MDPIIVWPSNAQLAPIIGEMQRLNPDLNLRCATTYWPVREERYRMEGGDEINTCTIGPFTSEYLVYDGSAFEVFAIAMPDPQSDQMMSALTEVNREEHGIATDIGRFRVGPWRIERTADGGLLIRPRKTSADAATDRFNLAWQGIFDEDQCGMIDQIGRISQRWGIFRDRHEMWEVEIAYLPEWFAVKYDEATRKIERDARRPSGDHGYWHTTPVGTISYIDRYDLPIEDHYARAQAIVAAGSEFAIVGDVERGEVRVFRATGVELHAEKFRMPDMPRFEVPIGRANEDDAW